MSDTVLEFRAVTKRFGTVNAVDQVSFSIETGEVFTLLGPSGCGKSTTLRLVAGLEEPDDGEILIRGKTVAAPGRNIFAAPEKRQLGMVFQSYAIWPHLSVFENVAFPLRVRHESAEAIRRRVSLALDSVGLGGLAERGATQLSGGQQQRVALARALVYEPALLLLDEPLSNLDAKLREQMRVEIRALQKRLGLTVLYVTHDQAEAMTLSDRIALVNRGRFEQVGTPEQVYEAPATPFVAEFLGRTVSFEATLIKNHAGAWIQFASGARNCLLSDPAIGEFSDGTAIRVSVRPEDIEIGALEQNSGAALTGQIEQIAYLGDRFEYHVNAAGMALVLTASKKRRFNVGAVVQLALDPARLTIQRL
ncbi:MAG TPA: ABC transporter ATP-binding protein [Candidatus Binatia bacterium]